MRRYTLTSVPRRVARDTELQGVALKENDRLVLSLPAADLDPEAYEEPERFNLNRPNKPHLAFGSGIHRCVGMHLARVELQLLLEQLLSILPEFRLAPGGEPTYHGGHVLGPERFTIEWDVSYS